jgi:hypothetical protein
MDDDSQITLALNARRKAREWRSLLAQSPSETVQQPIETEAKKPKPSRRAKHDRAD